MFFVVIALIPCYLFGAYNIGYLNALAMDIDRGLLANTIFGFGYVLPILIATFVAGAICELTFAIIRKHEVNEGFLVSCALIPLTMPPDVPLWQVFIGTSFGIIIGKEIFGGVGTNIFNPALTARAFMYFAFPTKISGDKVWAVGPDGYSGATALAIPANPVEYDTASNLFAASTQFDFSLINMFWGLIPGSIGETNKLLILGGAFFLVYCGIASWRIIFGTLIGMIVMSSFLNFVGSETNPMFSVPWYWHLTIGGFAFGLIFMATEPVTAASTNKGRWIYGLSIGVIAVLIRVVNPAFPEGMMLAILFANLLAPAIDFAVTSRQTSKRMQRYNS